MEVGARLEAVVDRLEVDGDDVGVGRVACDGDDVVDGHDQRAALEEAGAARVHDHDLGPVLVERGAHLVAPDRVPGDVERADRRTRATGRAARALPRSA